MFARCASFAEVRSTPKRLDLWRFAGLILGCVGDGKRFTIVLRTGTGAQASVEYAATFATKKHK